MAVRGKHGGPPGAVAAWRASAAALAGLTGLAAAPAEAGGGAHVVDDDAVLDPGVCHSENWLTLLDRQRSLLTVAPACTLTALPGVEWAAAAQHIAGPDGGTTTITPAAKWNLRSHTEAPFGLALSAAMVWNPAEARVEAVQFNLPVSTRVSERLTLHANLGWFVTPGDDDRHALFWGAQAEYFLRPNLVLMGEVFGQNRGDPGAQAGMRWTTDRGRMDVDLLAGRNIDGSGATSVTLGVTIRC